jgi:hypothetical protein
MVAAAPALTPEAPAPSAPVHEAKEAPAPAAAVASAPEPASTETPAVVAQAQPGAAPGVPGVLAMADGESPGARVEVQELKRTGGDTLTIRFFMINDADKPLGFGCGTFGDCGSISGTHLIDGKTTHPVVRDKEGHCLCSRGLGRLEPKSRVSLWARFPAPPASTQKVTVVVPHFLPMDDVPVGR